MTPLISVMGNWATASHVPDGLVDACCSAFHAGAVYTEAFKQGRWDGIVKLNTERQFPAGLVDRVAAKVLEITGKVAKINRPSPEPIDLSRLSVDYIAGYVLRWYQLEAIQALLAVDRGVVRSPTGSGKTLMTAVVARYLWEEKGWRSLIVVPKKGLAHQSQKELQDFYQGDIDVGILGDGKREFGDIIVATAATLLACWPRKSGRRTLPIDQEIRDVVTGFEVLQMDETHHASSDSWYEIAGLSRAVRRYGFSGTPLKDVALPDLRMTAATGSVVYEVPTDALIDEGTLALPRIVMVMSPNASGPELPKTFKNVMEKGKLKKKSIPLPYQDAYERAYTGNPHHNTAVVRAASWFVDRKKRTLILCRKKAHFTDIKKRLEAEGVNFLACWGATGQEERQKAKDCLNNGTVDCVLASTIWDEGEDVPGIDAIVLAEGVEVSTNSLQRIGRGMRKKGGANEVWVVDFVPTCHPTLSRHALTRCQSYEDAGYVVTLQEEWPSMHDNDYNFHDLLPFLKAA